MEYEFLVGNLLNKIDLEKKEDFFLVSDGENQYQANIEYICPNVISILVNGRSYSVYLAREKEKWYVFIEGHQFVVQEPSEEKSFAEEEEKAGEEMLKIKSPMPGKVIKINVSENQEIRKNQTLAVVEAMKMENEVKSSIDGFVKKIFVSDGDPVDSENPMIELGTKE